MIFPTIPVLIFSRIGTDIHGQAKFTPATAAKVAPVKLVFRVAHSTVRTDSSGSHGSASESTADVILLVRPGVQIKPDDELEVLGHRATVEAIHNRFSVDGKHDHNELHCLAA